MPIDPIGGRELLDFSIIIPAKNEEAYIGRCLDSILHTDYPRDRFEVLVVDNGSSDRTALIAAAKGASVFSAPEETIAGLRNFGVRRALGQILVFLDADCSVSSTWLDEAARYLTAHSIACFGAPPGIPEQATWVQKAWYQVRRNPREIMEVEWLESMNMFVRRDAFESVDGFDERLITCEDYDLCLRLKSLGKIVADGRISAIHHGEAATLTQFFHKERWRGTSNLRGVLYHGLQWRELPSLALPAIYCGLGLWVAAALIMLGIGPASLNPDILLYSFAAWQVPLVFYALWKSRGVPGVALGVQLFALLNLYFCARGWAFLLRSAERSDSAGKQFGRSGEFSKVDFSLSRNRTEKRK